MRVYYDRDADVNLIKGKKVAIVGYGSQGHAHALEPARQQASRTWCVALRKGSASAAKAEGEGLKVLDVARSRQMGRGHDDAHARRASGGYLFRPPGART